MLKDFRVNSVGYEMLGLNCRDRSDDIAFVAGNAIMEDI
ncbi:hypothetical protein HM1_2680 [Heliomicrobium modesticaldum Ice1]|uniref:Uncharacterized protein n=1 Tax=Heliobacterium modesticaldum (strain ATCC 51547 / Ice1) TaxID=498761 RepID=B0TBJ6_HELMI|nr:hypothetical protein HM1_2680 [Heliomicrobium modesticaldum Ice1]